MDFEAEVRSEVYRFVVETARAPTVPEVGAALGRLGQLWQLAQAWYSTRLTSEARRPAPAEMVEIFGRIGLTGPFWDPRADDFATGT